MSPASRPALLVIAALLGSAAIPAVLRLQEERVAADLFRPEHGRPGHDLRLRPPRRALTRGGAIGVFAAFGA